MNEPDKVKSDCNGDKYSLISYKKKKKIPITIIKKLLKKAGLASES